MSAFKGLTTIIMAGGRGERLFPLTRDKAKPAIIFGGIYRIIDFTLSNCLNSGIRRIYVLSQYGSFSLDQHLRVSWDLMRPELGEYIYSIPPQQITVDRWYRGTADSIYQNLKLLDEERPRQVLILSGDHVYKMDYGLMLDFHRSKGADLTVAAVPAPRREASAFGVLHVDADQQVIGFLEKPPEPPGMPENPDYSLVSMGIYVFEAEVLVRELIADAKNPKSQHDFGRNIIPQMVGRRKVYAFSFKDPVTREPGYWRDIGQLDAYFAAHLDLLGEKPVFDLYGGDWPIRGHLSPLPPAKYLGQHKPVEVTDSLISPGCVLHEARVSRSVLSPQVQIGQGAEVEEAILWDGVKIGMGAKIRRTVIEDGVNVPPRFTIGYDRKADARRFPVTEGGVVVVPNNVVLEGSG
jgi:glucose-1-phosphate adenylyltransferase|uniref:Glucose-1-phosphate adenylyltransferase n=1 Tax=Desulfobacca acetoxidans TaxID=60893 RepID=A0A7C5AM04_9BACT